MSIYRWKKSLNRSVPTAVRFTLWPGIKTIGDRRLRADAGSAPEPACTVRFQLDGVYYWFAEAAQSDCDITLFDSARHRADPGSTLINTHGRASVSVFDHQGRSYALRHYRRGGAIRHLSRDQFFWLGLERARPWREFRLLHAMHSMALPCPLPYACRVQKNRWSSSGSLITRFIPGTLTLAQRLATAELPDAQWYAVGRVIRRFHDANICHADLNANNILIDAQNRVYLIDFDNAAVRSSARSWKFANLKRLQRSIIKCWTQADSFYFSPASWECLRDGYLAVSKGDKALR